MISPVFPPLFSQHFYPYPLNPSPHLLSYFKFSVYNIFRAFEEPPRRALLYWNKHFRTDELLGAWLFLFGTMPAVPYALVYFIIDPSFTYIGDVTLTTSY